MRDLLPNLAAGSLPLAHELREINDQFPAIMGASFADSGLHPIDYSYTHSEFDEGVQRQTTKYTHNLPKFAQWLDGAVGSAGSAGSEQPLLGRILDGLRRECGNILQDMEPLGDLEQVHFLEQSSKEARSGSTFTDHQDKHLHVSGSCPFALATIAAHSHAACIYPHAFIRRGVSSPLHPGIPR